MRNNFRNAILGAVVGTFVGAVLLMSGCGSSSSTVPWRQVDRSGQPGLETFFLSSPTSTEAINAFNFLSPNGDLFSLDAGTTTVVSTQYRRLLAAYSALTCYVKDIVNNLNLKPFGRTCPVTNFTGTLPESFWTFLETDGVGAGEKFGVFQRFEAGFLPDVLRLDTDVTFANRGVLRYVYDNVSTESPLICSPGTGARPRTYCGGRRFSDDAIRFLYSQMFLGSVGSVQANLETVQDDGLDGAAPVATFPYLAVPAP